MWIIIWIIIFILCVIFNLFLITFDKKLKKLEKQIILLFEKRTHLVPSLYEITKKYLNKHEEVFQEIIHLRKIEFSNYNDSFLQRVKNETLIHHELNFIFKVANQHPKIQKDEKFLLIRDLFLDNSYEIGKKVEMYKKVITLLNKLIIFKNFTVIWIFVWVEKRTEI